MSNQVIGNAISSHNGQMESMRRLLGEKQSEIEALRMELQREKDRMTRYFQVAPEQVIAGIASDALQTLAAAARTCEREECAKIAESFGHEEGKKIAKKIRGR